MKTKKKLLSGILAASMLFGGELVTALPTLGTVAIAEESDSLWVYKVNDDDDTVCITGYSGFEKDLTIPTTLGGKKVTSIGQEAFEKNQNIGAVTIPEGITYIGGEAFEGSSITSVKIPKSVVEYGYGFSWVGDTHSTFKDCQNLVSVEINSPTVPMEGFKGCTSLKTVKVGEGVDLGFNRAAFENCTSLSVITGGKNVKLIGYAAFSGCTALKSYPFSNKLERIYGDAFKNTGLTSAILPSTLWSIGETAFAYSESLENVVIPASVNTWGANVFKDCSKLKSAILGCHVLPESNIFTGVSDDFTIKCINGSKAAEYAKTYELNCKADMKSSPGTALSFNKSEYTVVKGDTIQLYPNVNPANTTDGLVWTSGNEDIITVTGNGIVTGESVGTVALQCVSTSGFSDSCIIHVVDEEGAVSDVDVPAPTAARDITNAYLAEEIADQTYTGSAITPFFALMYNDVSPLIPGIDYTYTYSDNIKKGKATVTITGLGSYSGTLTVTFNIVDENNAEDSADTDTPSENGLPAVKNLKATSTTKAITLKWTKVEGADGYKVEKYDAAKMTWNVVKTITDNSTVSCKVTKLKAGNSYGLRVCAYKGTENGSYSMITANTKLAKVSSFKISKKAKTSLTLKWKKSAAASGYQIQQKISGKWKTIKTIKKANTTSFKVKKLKKKTSYKFRIRVYNPTGSTMLYGDYATASGKTK